MHRGCASDVLGFFLFFKCEFRWGGMFDSHTFLFVNSVHIIVLLKTNQLKHKYKKMLIQYLFIYLVVFFFFFPPHVCLNYVHGIQDAQINP